MTGKRKIGTVLDENLVREAKAAAAHEGVPMNMLLEKALRAYLEQRGMRRTTSVVDAGWAAIPVDSELLRQIMEEEGSVLDS